MTKLPKPKCKYGYTNPQIRKIMGDDLDRFMKWMRGQTIAECNGMEFDYETGKQRLSGCGPHHLVYYPQDVENFLEGGPILD